MCKNIEFSHSNEVTGVTILLTVYNIVLSRLRECACWFVHFLFVYNKIKFSSDDLHLLISCAITGLLECVSRVEVTPVFLL